MSVLALGRTILLVGMGTGYMMHYANTFEKVIQ